MNEKKSTTGSLVKAFLYVFESIHIPFKHKNLFIYFAVPFILNLLLLSALVYFTFSYIHPQVSALLTGDGVIIKIARYVITPVLFFLVLILSMLIYSITGTIICSPFNDLLSKKIEELVSGKNCDEPFSIIRLFRDIFRIAANMAKLIILMLLIYIIILLLNIIPILGSALYVFIGFGVTSFFLGFQFFDFPMERRRINFDEKLKIAVANAPAVTGVGAAYFILSFIPVVGFLGLNLATIAATRIFLEDMDPKEKSC